MEIIIVLQTAQQFLCILVLIWGSVTHIKALKTICRDSLSAGQSRDGSLVKVRFSTPMQTSPGAYIATCTMGTRFLPWGYRGMAMTTHPHLVSKVKKVYSYKSTLLLGLYDLF